MKTVFALLLTLGTLAPPQAAEPAPLTYGVLVDRTTSVGAHFGDVLTAAREVLRRNGPHDETALVSFTNSDSIKIAQDFTPDESELLAALDTFHTDPGRSALIDALYLAAEHVAERHKARGLTSRPAVVVVTDGEDRESYYKPGQLLARLKASGVRVFTVGIVAGASRKQGLMSPSPREKGVKLLEKIARESGGRAFVVQSGAELPGIAHSIGEEMRRP